MRDLFDQSDIQRELGLTMDRCPRMYRTHRRVATLARELGRQLGLKGDIIIDEVSVSLEEREGSVQ